MMFAKLLSFALLCVCSSTVNAATVEMGSIVMQLRSAVDGNNSEVIAQMLTTTTSYLNDYFGAYYRNTEPQDYFSDAVLSVNSFGIHGGQGSYITTLEIEGMVFFNSDPAPSEAFTLTLLSNAFQGLNQKIFLNKIVNGESQFLNELTYMVIEINDLEVAENNLVEGIEDVEKEIEDEEEKWYDADWVEYAVFAVAGVGGASAMLCLFFLCRCCCSTKQQENEDGESPVKVIDEEVGTKNHQRRVSRRPNNEATLEIAKTYSSGNSQSRSPSPERSMASQDSSIFTYNPAGISMSKDGISLGSISNIHTELPSFDLEAWQNKNTISPVTPAPFGHDISAIDDQNQTKDLSLIDEGSEDSYQDRAAKVQMQSRYRPSMNALEVRQSRSRPVPKQGYSQPSNSRMLDYSKDDSSSYRSESSGDVINDLRNLSAQIDRHRRAKGEY
jgi:hypothetical protein